MWRTTRLFLYTQESTQDRTHPPEYYNPEYGVIIDHGTVGVFLFILGE